MIFSPQFAGRNTSFEISTVIYCAAERCSKFQTLKPAGLNSKRLFIEACLPAQLWSRNVVSTCACHCVCVNVKCRVRVLRRRVPDVDVVQVGKLLAEQRSES